MIDAYLRLVYQKYTFHIPLKHPIHSYTWSDVCEIPVSRVFQMDLYDSTFSRTMESYHHPEKNKSSHVKHNSIRTHSLSKKKKTPHLQTTEVTKQPALFFPIEGTHVNQMEKIMLLHETQSDSPQSGVSSESDDMESRIRHHETDDTSITTEVESPSTTTASLEQLEVDTANQEPCIIMPQYSISVPTVSIIMTTYNCAKYIEFAIRSIQLQTLTNWELIIIDDRSTDNTDSLLRTIAQHDDRIVYLHNKCNLGCYVSKNIGIQYARGTWLTFQDADDYSMSERLEKQLSLCMYGKDARDIQEHKIKTNEHVYDCCYVMSLSRKEKVWSWVPITLFIHSNVFRSILGSFDNVRFGADSEIRGRIETLQMRVGLCDDYLYACPDRWIELSSREQSLTGNTKHDPVRVKYKRSYTQFHRYVRELTSSRKHLLHYTFTKQSTQLPCRPFEISDLKSDESKLLFPQIENFIQSMQIHSYQTSD